MIIDQVEGVAFRVFFSSFRYIGRPNRPFDLIATTYIPCPKKMSEERYKQAVGEVGKRLSPFFDEWVHKNPQADTVLGGFYRSAASLPACV